MQTLVEPGGWMCFPLLGSSPKLSPVASVCVCDLRAKPESVGAEHWCTSFLELLLPVHWLSKAPSHMAALGSQRSWM